MPEDSRTRSGFAMEKLLTSFGDLEPVPFNRVQVGIYRGSVGGRRESCRLPRGRQLKG